MPAVESTPTSRCVTKHLFRAVLDGISIVTMCGSFVRYPTIAPATSTCPNLSATRITKAALRQHDFFSRGNQFFEVGIFALMVRSTAPVKPCWRMR